MKVAYFDCSAGISGDMILGALVELGFDLQKLARKLHCKVGIRKVRKNGIAGTKVDVLGLAHEHHHRDLAAIYRIIDKSRLDKDIKKKSKEIFLKLARAESRAHGVALEKAHFHELGSMDTIVDIAGSVAGIKWLGVQKVYASSLNLGSGKVKCRHGLLPVPAPATAYLVSSVPVYTDGSGRERVTPTGAAVITTIAQEFGGMPEMTVLNVANGAGASETRAPNLLRIFLGEQKIIRDDRKDTVDVIDANIDDMNPEFYEYIIQKFLKQGALDVTVAPIQMKKHRPGVTLSVISPPKKTARLTGVVFQETTTFGVRIYKARREKLTRVIKSVKTKYGRVNVKVGSLNGKVVTVSPEYSDCVLLAKKKNIPLRKIYQEALSSK